MLVQGLLAAVERDLLVARQLAHYHVDLSGSGGIRSADDVAADESGATTNPFHFATCSAAFPLAHSRHSASTAAAAAAPPFTSPEATPACAARSGNGSSSSAAAAVPLRVVLTNAVQRPRQGTCAVLMELSRPLPWLSQRGRYRSSAVTGGTRGTAGSTATMSTTVGAAPSTAAGGGGAGAAAGRGTSSSAVFGAPGSGAASASSGGRAVGGLHGSNSITSAAAAGATAASSSPGVPLLIATATLEVVFPARYPSEPCHWHLSEEVSFGGMGDHSTSSWAVTAGHIRGNTTGASGGNGNSSGSTGGSPRFPLPHHPHPGVGGRGNSRAWYGAGGGDGAGPAASEGGSSSGVAHSAAAEDNGAVPTLKAFVVPEVGRRLLRWIAEARVSAADSSTSTAAPLTSPREAWDSAADTPQHRRGTRLHHTDVSPFLLDFAVLLRCWSSVEVDVHHLVLPSRIALAYSGGGGARLLRAMTGTHLSGGAAAGAAVAGAAGAGSGGGGFLASAGGPLQVAGGGGVTALPAAASVGGTTSSTVSVAAPAQSGTTTIGASGGLGGGRGGAVTAGGGSGGAGPAPPAVAGASAGAGPVVTGAAAAPGASAGGVSVLYPYRRRPVKSFMALLLPLGEVAVWGTPLPARRAVHLADSGAAAPAWLPARRLPPVLRQLYESARHDAVRPTSVAVSCTTQFMLGKVLPTYVLPCHVLGTPYKCDWDAVRLFTGKSADAALHANAKLAKALRLPDVSDLLQVLRRLSKNVGAPSTGVLYISAVVWPALMEAVRVLRDGRRPFWGGLAACSLLLPGVLQQDSKSDAVEGGSVSRSRGCASVSIVPDENAAPAPWRRRHLAELIEVVTYVEHILALAREHTLLCEARLVRCALQRGLHLVQQCSDAAVGPHTTTLWPTATGAAAAVALSTPGKSAQAVERGAAMGAAASAVTALVTPFTPIVIASADMCRRLHAPITTCAVCGLSLLGSTVTTADVGGGGMSAAGLSPAPTHADAVRLTSEARRVEGCLVVQCARCGHGGHVEHISSWWNDPTVRCCPKGCDCRCTY